MPHAVQVGLLNMLFEYWPVGQALHLSCAPSGWYMPDGQWAQKLVPTPGMLLLYLPAGQASQRPFCRKKPVRQLMTDVHLVAPAALSCPEGQVRQQDAPTAAL